MGIVYAKEVLHYPFYAAMMQSIMSRRLLYQMSKLKRQVPEKICGPSQTAVALLLILLSLASCSQVAVDRNPAEPTAVLAALADETARPAPATPTVAVESATIATATPVPPAPTVTAENSPKDLSITAEDIQLFPVPKIISGDRVTFQVQPFVPEEMPVENVSVDIYVDGNIVSAGNLSWRNWEGKAQGVYEWVWNTSGLPGWHEIRVVLDSQDLFQQGDEDPSNNETVFTVRVGKTSERPLEERDASWITAETDCCFAHTLTRTAAYRDFPELLVMLDSAVSEASSRVNEFPQEKIDVYFVERTVGQGGYAGSGMVIVYNDRPYIGGELYELIVHESTHIIDRQFAPQRTKFLSEGVAVWAAGGHYEKQDLQRRAAALLATNKYIPLADLANNFYPAQHEIGYLEAGAFFDYLVSVYGWPDVREFYSNTSVSDGATEADALDANIQRYFDMSLAEMETQWLAELAALELTEKEIAELQTTIRYYETARQYQKLYDPTAYFRTAWLPRPADVVESGNAADFLRQPDTEVNFTVELMLRSAKEAIDSEDFARANVILDSLQRFLKQDGGTFDPLFTNYQNIVHTAVAFGYEPHNVALNGDTAVLLATTASGTRLFDLELELQRGDWILLSN